MSEAYIKHLHETAKAEADMLRGQGLLPQREDNDEDVLAHMDYAGEQFIDKFEKGAKEHGGSIHDRDPLLEAKNEVIDLWHYLSAAQNRIEALRKYYTSPEYHAAICNEYQARYITGHCWSPEEYFTTVSRLYENPIILATPPSSDQGQPVDSRTEAFSAPPPAPEMLAQNSDSSQISPVDVPGSVQ